VLVIAIALESFSLRTALHESAPQRRGISVYTFVRRSKAPELPVVLLEDIAALAGLMFALVGVGASVITGDGVWDGIGTVAIGVLLIMVALVLGVETQSLLVGEGAAETDVQAMTAAALEGQDIEKIIHMRTLYLGPEEMLVAMKVAVRGSASAADIAASINAVEARVRAAVPAATVMYVEPDLFDANYVPADRPAAPESGGH
jgi:divalent metal cation (Fe/Co/Zn/Cd) transporter